MSVPALPRLDATKGGNRRFPAGCQVIVRKRVVSLIPGPPAERQPRDGKLGPRDAKPGSRDAPMAR